MFTLLVDHANRSISQLRGKLCLSVHSSIFSKVGASAKPGAIHCVSFFTCIGKLILGATMLFKRNWIERNLGDPQLLIDHLLNLKN